MDLIMEDEEGGEGATHFDRPILLPDDLENYEGKFIVSPGRPGIPATVPSWSQADEKKVLDILIKELNAAAATSWEGSPAEAGVGPGTAGRAAPHSIWRPAS